VAASKRVPNPMGKGTIQKGGLHRSVGVPQGQKIPAAKLAAAKAGKYGPLAKKQAQFASSLAKVRPKAKKK
jgi:hypothetical protein